MSQVSYHSDAAILQDFAGEISSPFLRYDWFKLLENPNETQVFAQYDDEFGSAIMALRRANGRLEPLINWYSFDWAPLVEDHQSQQALQELCAALSKQSHRITLWPLKHEDGSADRIQNALHSAGWKVFRDQCDVNHALHVNKRSFAEYHANLPGRLRTTLKRKSKKVDIEISTQFDDGRWSSYEKIYEKSWKPEEGDPVLLKKFAKNEADAGRMRLGMAYADDKPVAAQFWTVDAGTAYIHKLAYDEGAKSISPGTSLTAALMEHVIDIDRVEWVDFGTGDDSYKRDWMDTVRPRYRLDCFWPGSFKSWLHLSRRYLRQLAQSGPAG